MADERKEKKMKAAMKVNIEVTPEEYERLMRLRAGQQRALQRHDKLMSLKFATDDIEHWRETAALSGTPMSVFVERALSDFFADTPTVENHPTREAFETALNLFVAQVEKKKHDKDRHQTFSVRVSRQLWENWKQTVEWAGLSWTDWVEAAMNTYAKKSVSK